jgi:thiol:disulfide interchange protein DsbD
MWKFLLFFSLSAPTLTLADAELAKINPLSGRGFFTSETLRAGELADLQLELNLRDGFFAYQDKFRLKVVAPENIAVGELFIDPIVEFQDNLKKVKKGVKGQATLNTQVQMPESLSSQPEAFKLALSYIACTEKFCLTPRTLELVVNAPQILVTELRQENEKSTASLIEETIAGNKAYAFLLIFFFGIMTSLTPCIYPLIPITLAVLGANDKRTSGKSFLISLSYVFGIGLTYALLGVIAAQTGQLFGSFISHPAVALTMAALFFAMGLSLLGLFEIQAPAFIRNRAANSRFQGGFAGAFVSGLFAGVIASPCVGPVLVGILAYIANTQDAVLGFFMLFTFAMGFGLLFLVLGTFSQLAGQLPRSGAWMNSIKTILALVLFGLSFYYAWPVVKPLMSAPVETSALDNKKSKPSWQEFSPAKVEAAKAQAKPVIIDFFADWCVACVEMDKFTFSKSEIIEKSKEFVMLKIDATSPFEELTDWQQKYKVYGLPTMIFIDSSGRVREDLTLTGFEEAADFAKRMDRVRK